jgi:plasmid stabilization system protein ParE
MTPRFLVELEAATDLDDAFTWYERRLPGLGSEFTRAVRATFAAIQRQPESYARAHEEIRRAHVRRFPFAVYYVIEPEQIAVIAVAHTRRHPRRWQSRR